MQVPKSLREFILFGRLPSAEHVAYVRSHIGGISGSDGISSSSSSSSGGGGGGGSGGSSGSQAGTFPQQQMGSWATA